MKNSIIRSRVWILALMSGLVLAALPTDMRAQERWGEVGVSGMAIRLDYETLVLPGFALNVGAWHKTYAIEGYALFYAYLPVAFGASVIVSPFRTSKITPYLSAGGIYAGEFLCVGPGVILNAGIGLKFPISHRWGIRSECRLLIYEEDGSRWHTGGAIIAGLYITFGRRAGASRR